MPIAAKHVKVPTMGAGWYPPDHPKHVKGLGFNTHATKNTGGSWFNGAHNTESGHSRNPVHEGIKNTCDWWSEGKGVLSATTSSHSHARKQASAMIAKIPFPLSSWIARCFKPKEEEVMPDAGYRNSLHATAGVTHPA